MVLLHVMEIYNWERNFKPTLTVMKYMGLWPDGPGYKSGTYVLYTTVMASLYAIYVLTLVINIYFVRDDLKAVAGIIYISLIALVGVCKTYNLLKKMRLLKETILKLRSRWFQPRNYEKVLIVEPNVKFWRNLFNTYMGSLMVSNIFWVLYPLVDNNGEERRLPFQSWYPFDYKVSPYYEIVYILQVVTTMYVTMIHVNVDALISGFNVCIGCQFDLLTFNVRSLGWGMTTAQLRENIVRCVLHHREILHFVKGFSHFTDWILFWHLIFSGISIGVIMFQLTMTVPFSNEFFSYASFGVAVTIEIFIYCWFGNEIEVKSGYLAYAAFESNWMEQPQYFKKELIFFILQVMKSVNVSALDVFIVNLQTFMTILRTAWSYFALLTTLNRGK